MRIPLPNQGFEKLKSELDWLKNQPIAIRTVVAIEFRRHIIQCVSPSEDNPVDELDRFLGQLEDNLSENKKLTGGSKMCLEMMSKKAGEITDSAVRAGISPEVIERLERAKCIVGMVMSGLTSFMAIPLILEQFMPNQIPGLSEDYLETIINTIVVFLLSYYCVSTAIEHQKKSKIGDLREEYHRPERRK